MVKEKKVEEKKSSLEKTSEKEGKDYEEEDSEGKKEDSEISKQQKKKQNKQIILIIGIMFIIIMMFFIVPYFVKNYMNSFFYAGLNFQKTKQGEVFYYSTYVPITDKNYKVTGSYPVNFRNDPRKLGSIKVDLNNIKINNSKLSFIRENTVYITIASDSPRCEQNAAAGARLAAFLNGFGGLNVAGALDNKTFAEENKMPYVICKTNPYNTVLLLKPGDKTEIIKTGENCYELWYKDCEISSITERLQLSVLETYMDYLKGN